VPEWVFWMIGAGVLAIGEMATLGFFLGPIAIAAVAAAVVALIGVGLGVQIAVFILIAVASLAIIRPVARRHLRTPARLRTNTAALVGERAVVIDAVSADGGRVKLGGEVWTARTYDEDDVFEPGSRVEVMKIEGATALVSE
jgi:membrane protein implicated in regulation of membrane protease activity